MFFWINYAAPASTTTRWEDCYHRIVDVQGDTDVDILVPWLKQGLVDFSSTTGDGLKLYVTILSWSQPDTAITCPIYFNVYKAAHTDYKWFELLDKGYQVDASAPGLVEDYVELESNPRLDFAKDFQPIHESIVGFTHDGYIGGEEYKSLRQIVHRYQPYYKQNATLNSPNLFDNAGTSFPAAPNVYFMGIEAYAQIFSFWRGSIRIKMLQRNTQKCQALIFDRVTDAINMHAVTISSPTNPVLEATVPYYYQDMFKSTRRGANVNNNIKWVVSQMAEEYFLLKAFGDDASLHFLTAPPSGFYANGSAYSASPTGFDGILDFYNGNP